MDERRSPFILILSVLIMAGVCGGLFWFRSSRTAEKIKEKPVPQTNEAVVVKTNKKQAEISEINVISRQIDEAIEQQLVEFSHSAELVQNFEQALEEIEDEAALVDLLEKLGLETMPEAEAKILLEAIGKGGIHLKRGNLTDEIGELERRKKSRWALNLKDGGRIFFDLKKKEDGTWKLEKLHLPSQGNNSLESILEEGSLAQHDPLSMAHSFVEFAIQQEFAKAKQLVDKAYISDVQLAGLCILFDEGGYQLREPRGVLRQFHRPVSSGYSVYIENSESEVAQFSLLLKRPDDVSAWRINELNFSSLLETFIKNNGGDSYYSPFVKNPKGGESIVVYFGFNEEVLSARTQRQLKIVSHILKLDANKKITLTGHTDSKGSDAYNKKLSNKRAKAVRDFLEAEGVNAAQIQTIGYGAYRPRKANTNADGSDNPDGRSANRRAEIYLDF